MLTACVFHRLCYELLQVLGKEAIHTVTLQSKRPEMQQLREAPQESGWSRSRFIDLHTMQS